MTTISGPTFTTLENSKWRQQLSEQKPEVINQSGEELAKSQGKGLDLDDDEMMQDVNEANSKGEEIFSYCWKNVEKIVRCAESFFNLAYKLIYGSLIYSFGFIKCSIKCLTDFAFVNLIRELNIVRQLSINIGTFSDPTQQPNIVNNYYIVIISGTKDQI